MRVQPFSSTMTSSRESRHENAKKRIANRKSYIASADASLGKIIACIQNPGKTNFTKAKGMKVAKSLKVLIADLRNRIANTTQDIQDAVMNDDAVMEETTIGQLENLSTLESKARASYATILGSLEMEEIAEIDETGVISDSLEDNPEITDPLNEAEASVDEAEDQPEDQPEGQPEEQPEAQTEEQPEDDSEDQPEDDTTASDVDTPEDPAPANEGRKSNDELPEEEPVQEEDEGEDEDSVDTLISRSIFSEEADEQGEEVMRELGLGDPDLEVARKNAAKTASKRSSKNNSGDELESIVLNGLMQ